MPETLTSIEQLTPGEMYVTTDRTCIFTVREIRDNELIAEFHNGSFQPGMVIQDLIARGLVRVVMQSKWPHIPADRLLIKEGGNGTL